MCLCILLKCLIYIQASNTSREFSNLLRKCVIRKYIGGSDRAVQTQSDKNRPHFTIVHFVNILPSLNSVQKENI